jgi:tRNA threonylcarbamoyladenosine biosynthesis protein TsaE
MSEPETYGAANEAETRAVGAQLAHRLSIGDVVLLDGPLGAGKTTLVRGLLEELGYDKTVRSPTFNLIQTFDTNPPVMHADLYRVKSYEGIGLEDYLDTHLCLIEWPDRATGLVDPQTAWQVHIDFDGAARTIRITLQENLGAV